LGLAAEPVRTAIADDMKALTAAATTRVDKTVRGEAAAGCLMQLRSLPREPAATVTPLAAVAARREVSRLTVIFISLWFALDNQAAVHGNHTTGEVISTS
jgi:hypothetical protein